LIVFNYLDTMTPDDVISKVPVHCIFILWVNTQNLTGWKWWYLWKKCHLMKY